MKNRNVFSAVTVLLLLAPGVVVAQQSGGPGNEATGQISGLPLDLLPPGARALGVGGAFTAVADDATAALANPAGLTNLSATEVSISFRNVDSDVVILDPDAYDSAVNYYAGDLNKTFSDSSTDVSFASFVIPFDKVTVSGFYASQINFNAQQSEPDELFDQLVRDSFESDGVVYDYAYLDGYSNFNSVKAKLSNYGLSGAFRMSDSLSLGLTVKNSKLDLNSQDSWQSDYWNDIEWVLADGFSPTGLGTLSEAESYLGVIRDNYSYETLIDDSDSGLSYDIGLLYKAEKWSLGAVYHYGAKFKLATVGSASGGFACVGGSDNEFAENCILVDDLLQQDWEDSGNSGDWWQDFYPSSMVQGEANIKVPDVFSLGFAFRPTDTFLVSLDINWIGYSDLNAPRMITQGFGENLNNVAQRTDYNLDGTNVPFNDPAVRDSSLPYVEDIDNEVTFHIGAEKFFVFQDGVLRTLALRGGAFTVKDHDGNALYDGDDTVWTLGLGTTWGEYGGSKAFQLDLAASFADDVTNVILSGIFRF